VNIAKRKDISGHHYHRVLIPRELYQPDTRSWSPTLALRTQLCSITSGATLPPDTHESLCKDVSLVDSKGSVIGALHTNNIATTTPGIALPFVVISRGIITLGRPHTWEMPEMSVFHADCGPACFGSSCRAEARYVPYDFYNVMWIRWVDGIAYREGIGRVLRSAWEGEAGGG